MRNKNLLLCVAASLILFACSNQSNEKNTTTDTVTKNDESKPGSLQTKQGEVRSTINVNIGGGDMNGSYSAECRDACCSWGIAGENVFGNQYSEQGKGPKELSSVQLIVDDVKEGSKSTKEFTLTVSFGELFSDKEKQFNINTRNGSSKGSGTLDLQFSGDKATVTVKGTSAEGPTIDLKMECNKVTTAKNIGQ